MLELCISQRIYKEHPDWEEGQMTRIRSSLVCAANLAAWSRALNLSAYIRMGKGLQKDGGANNDNVLSDTLEAIIGAIYLDGGLDAADKFLRGFDKAFPGNNAKDPEVKDPKSKLQEFLQSKGYPFPVYRTVGEEGPAHDRTFKVQVWCQQTMLADGTGKSLRQAEKNAAQRALNNASLKAL